MNDIGAEIDMNSVTNQLSRCCDRFICVMSEELRIVATDAGILLIIALAPIIYTVIYSMAYGPNVVNLVPIGVVDDDHTEHSRQLIDYIDSGDAVSVVVEPISMGYARQMI